jgi:hypothetical protein
MMFCLFRKRFIQMNILFLCLVFMSQEGSAFAVMDRLAGNKLVSDFPEVIELLPETYPVFNDDKRNSLFNYPITSKSQSPKAIDDALVITCPADITIQCTQSTLPSTTGNPSVTDPCDPTPTIAYYDYTITPPTTGSEMRWVYLPPGSTTGSCSSGTNCQNGTICIGLEYTPDTTGTLTTYTTGFIMNCYNGNNPVVSNTSCVMTNNGNIIDDCANSGLMLMNSSGNNGAVPIQQYVPIILHQVCLQLGSGGNILLDEDESTDLTASIEVQNGGLITDLPSYTNFTAAYDVYCSAGCQFPNTIYRRFVVTDDCNNLTTCLQQITIKDTTPPVLTCPPNITITYPASTNPTNTGTATAVDACSTSPVVSYQDSLPGVICPQNNIIKRTWQAVDKCGNQSNCVQWITVHDQGTICGNVHDELNQPMSGVQIKLYVDLNNNLALDGGDVLVTTTNSAANGSYCFTNVNPCHYVLVEMQPAGYGNVSDFDNTPDPDGDDSADGPDNQIPVNLTPLENDSNNDFIDLLCPSILPTLPFDTLCSGQSETLLITDLNLGTLTYSWDFGSGSTPGTGMGIGPHIVSYVTTTQNQASGASVVLTISKAGCNTLSGEVTNIDVNAIPDPTINVNTTPVCYYTNKIFQPVAPSIPGATYNWTFGVDAVPSTAIGYGPHTVYYTSSGTKSAKLVIYPNEAGAQCPDSSTVSFTITSCPAQILGYVLSATNVPINNVTLKLYSDNNLDGVADNGVPVRIVTSSVSGLYVMASLVPGSYVIVETQPSGWVTLNDYDASNDGDLVTNISGLDNLIPATATPSEIDSMNNFIESPQAGSITGNVFDDGNGDMLPDPGEGINAVTVKLFTDSNLDGIADNNTPVAVQTTDATGAYLFTSVAIGSYVLVEANPAGYFSVKDYDPTNDGDLVPNTNMNNDTIPLTMTNGESDANNYFLDALLCPLIVATTSDTGYASLRYVINCANPNDTIRFNASLSGSTILLTSQHIDLTKNLVILSTLSPRLTISSSTIGLFKVLANVTVEFKGLNLTSGNVTGQEGAAFDNFGQLKLNNINVNKNTSFPAVERLIRNQIGSSLFLSGTCKLQY